MKSKSSRKTDKPADPTRNARQARRVAALKNAAYRDGFDTWSGALTMWMKGSAVMVRLSDWRRASAAEAEVARLRADLMSPFAILEIEQAIDILEGLNDRCNIGEIDQHASPALGIAIDVLCKLIGIKAAAAVDALHDVTLQEHGDNDSEAME